MASCIDLCAAAQLHGAARRVRWLLPVLLMLGLALCRGEVHAADVPPEDVLLEVGADTQTPYVQARLRYRVRVLARVPLRGATLTEPAGEGALIRRLGQERRTDVVRSGREYRVIERLYSVVPQRAGEVTIAAPTLSAAVPLRALDGAQASDALIERRTVISRIAPDLVLRVQPPPAGAEAPWLPAESVSVSETWQPPQAAQLNVGEPLTRRIVIEATGIGAAALTLPDTPAVEGLQVYAEPAQTELRQVGDDLALTTVLTQTLVPTLSGILRLPELRLPWWSLGADAPRQAVLPARELVVAAAGSEQAATGAPATAWRERFLARAGADAWTPHALAALFGMGWLVTLLLWWRDRRRRGATADAHTPADAPAPHRSMELQRGFRLACERDDAREARRLLGAWANAQRGGRGERPAVAAALRAAGADDQALFALRDLDRFVYGAGAATTGTWRGALALRSIAPLLGASPKPLVQSPAELPPLFPAAADR
jgi:hypothetical protein